MSISCRKISKWSPNGAQEIGQTHLGGDLETQNGILEVTWTDLEEVWEGKEPARAPASVPTNDFGVVLGPSRHQKSK